MHTCLPNDKHAHQLKSTRTAHMPAKQKARPQEHFPAGRRPDDNNLEVEVLVQERRIDIRQGIWPECLITNNSARHDLFQPHQA